MTSSSSRGIDFRLLQHELARVLGALQEVGRHPLEITPRQRDGERLSLVIQADRNLGAGAQLTLGVFALLRERAECFGIFPRVLGEFAFELLADVVHDPLRPVETAEHHVAVGRQDAEVGRRVADDRDVERSAPQVVDEDRLFLGFEIAATQLAL